MSEETKKFGGRDYVEIDCTVALAKGEKGIKRTVRINIDDETSRDWLVALALKEIAIQYCAGSKKPEARDYCSAYEETNDAWFDVEAYMTRERTRRTATKLENMTAAQIKAKLTPEQLAELVKSLGA